MSTDALRASVLGRVKRLERRDRAVLMCASVIGLRFDAATLAASAGCAPAHVATVLEQACLLQLLEPDSSVRGGFTFRHALTRDVIYGELLAARTRPLHRRIARVLERDPSRGAAALEQVAYHWWAAGDVRRGLHANELAGDRAAEVHATDDALVHYHRALGLVEVTTLDHERLLEKIRLMKSLEAAE